MHNYALNLDSIRKFFSVLLFNSALKFLSYPAHVLTTIRVVTACVTFKVLVHHRSL